MLGKLGRSCWNKCTNNEEVKKFKPKPLDFKSLTEVAYGFGFLS